MPIMLKQGLSECVTRNVITYTEHEYRWVLLRGCNIVLLCTQLSKPLSLYNDIHYYRSITLSAACVHSTYHTPDKEIVMGRC